MRRCSRWGHARDMQWVPDIDFQVIFNYDFDKVAEVNMKMEHMQSEVIFEICEIKVFFM